MNNFSEHPQLSNGHIYKFHAFKIQKAKNCRTHIFMHMIKPPGPPKQLWLLAQASRRIAFARAAGPFFCGSRELAEKDSGRGCEVHGIHWTIMKIATEARANIPRQSVILPWFANRCGATAPWHTQTYLRECVQKLAQYAGS